MNIPSVQSLLKKYNIRPKKRMGQNYLIAQPTMLKIVDSLGMTKNDVVLEIGCGFGVMTSMLAQRCKRVIAVDADGSSLDIAVKEFESLKNVEWIHADILDVDIASLAKSKKILVIGNIPYNISSPIMFHLLDNRECIDRAVLMMQKEVVDRVVTKPGGKDYGALSVMMQSFADCTKLFNVARTNFIPPPDVTSSVININFNRHAPVFEDLRRIVQAAFQQRRKTLRNALLGSKDLHLKPDHLDRILAELDIDPRRRPETLSVEDFHRLAAALL